ncbi:hypothetical protein JCM25156A_10580 [Komagataeibacter kakiaceti JCM 25156]
MPRIDMIYCEPGAFHMPGGLLGFSGIRLNKQNPHNDHPVDIYTSSTYKCVITNEQPKVDSLLRLSHEFYVYAAPVF